MERREQSRFDWIVVVIARSIADNVIRDPKRFVEIDQLIVGVGARRSGVGRSLLEAPKTWAREQGISQLAVSAWAFHHANDTQTSPP